MNTALKIGIVVLAVGAAASFVLFGGEFFKSAELAPVPGEEKSVSPTSSPSAPPAETSASEPEKTPSQPLQKEEKPPSQKTPQVSQPEAQPKLLVCEYKEFIVRIFSVERAEPANLTIYVGDTITLVNEDNELRWPGADPHPTHSSLPLFDALGGISPGQSFSYTFKQKGRYNWHDHIPDNPPTVGFITVLPCAKN